MSARLLVLFGPNLNLLGEREPAIYGSATLDDHVRIIRTAASAAGMEVDHLQSAVESELVDAVHSARTSHDAIMINPGAFTHYSWAIHDALAAYDGPVIEVHLSNPQSRERWRHTSVVSPVATAMICGLGALGYRLGVEAVAALLVDPAG